MDVRWIDMGGWISLAVVLGFNFIDVLRRTQPVRGCTSLPGAQVTVWVCWATSPFAPPAQTLTGPLSRSTRTWVLRSQRPAWNPTKSKWKVQHPVEFSLLRLHSDVPFEYKCNSRQWYSPVPLQWLETQLPTWRHTMALSCLVFFANLIHPDLFPHSL